MINISEIVAKTEAMFDLLNEHFYQNELIRPAITVSSDNGRGAYGWCSIYEIWQGANEAHREINITAEYINRPIGEVAATMLHEMAHLYNMVHEIKDVSNNGYYHNKKFKAEAERRGLHIDHHDKYGWTITSPSDRLLQFCLDNDLSDILINRNEFYGYRVTGTGTHSGTVTTLPPKTSSTRKYLCPCCGNSVRATKAVNIACLDCAEQMVLAG